MLDVYHAKTDTRLVQGTLAIKFHVPLLIAGIVPVRQCAANVAEAIIGVLARQRVCLEPVWCVSMEQRDHTPISAIGNVQPLGILRRLSALRYGVSRTLTSILMVPAITSSTYTPIATVRLSLHCWLRLHHPHLRLSHQASTRFWWILVPYYLSRHCPVSINWH